MHRLRKFSVYIILGFIFLVALFLRIDRLSEFPVGFHIDEASLGYNGYSLLMTGKDENNHPLPLYIDMFGDNRPSGYHYLTILPVKFFGLTEFATRLPGALFGSITVFAIYFLTHVLFHNKKLSLITSLLFAIAPWHIVLSRASAETIVALFFIITGFAFLLKSMQDKSIKELITGSILITVSFFFYHTPRVFVPTLFLTFLVSLIFVWYRKSSKQYIASLVSSFITISVIAIALVFFVSGGTGRFNQVNIFGFPETKLVMNEQIQEDGIEKTNIIATRFFHNKLINYSLTFVTNYLEYFTGEFLFIKGGLPIWYMVPRMGLFYLLELPFLVLGIIVLAVEKKVIYKVPLLWLLVAPLTAALTVDDIPNINRVIVMFPMLEIIAAYGLLTFVSRNSKKIATPVTAILIVCMVISFLYFHHQYFVHSHAHRTWYRNNGFAEMITYVKGSYDNYDKIIVTKGAGGIYPLILFYMQYDPRVYQAEGSPKGKDFGGFGKFYFVPQGCPTTDKDDRFPKVEKALYVNNGNCPDVKLIKYKDIYKEDGTRAFRLQL